ncbi:MAG: hypothetical protein ACRDYY_17220 [Acidimicrobiales bacterium]
MSTAHPRRAPAAGIWLAVAVAFAAGVWVLYLLAAHTVVANSDAATQILEGQSVTGGHVLLAGWTLSLDSFWATEVPFYALAHLLVGVQPYLLPLVPAVIAALVVAAGTLIAVEGRATPAAAAGAVTVVALLLLPTYAMSQFFLRGGDHIGAVLFALIAFYAIRRGRWGPGVVVAVVVLAAAMLGDLQAMAYGAGPMLVAGVATMLRWRSVRAGLPAACAATGGGLLAFVARRVVDTVGTFSIGAPNPIASLHQVIANVGTAFNLGAQMVGTGNGLFGTGGVPRGLQDVRLVEAALLAWCLALALLRLLCGVVSGRPRRRRGPIGPNRTAWWQSEPTGYLLDDMLVLAAVGSAASYVALAYATQAAFGRYLVATIIFMVVLAGRVAARTWDRVQARRLKQGVALLAAGVTLCFAASAGYLIFGPRPANPATSLATWLQAHDLTSGVGAYWDATITTVESGDQVQVRPVIADPGGRLVRYTRESTADWYTGRPFQFLVFEPDAIWNGVDLDAAVRTFGRPARTFHVGGYEILVWSQPVEISPSGGYGA